MTKQPGETVTLVIEVPAALLRTVQARKPSDYDHSQFSVFAALAHEAARTKALLTIVEDAAFCTTHRGLVPVIGEPCDAWQPGPPCVESPLYADLRPSQFGRTQP